MKKEIMMKAPVAIFAYNRVEHLRKIIQALEENVGGNGCLYFCGLWG